MLTGARAVNEVDMRVAPYGWSSCRVCRPALVPVYGFSFSLRFLSNWQSVNLLIRRDCTLTCEAVNTPWSSSARKLSFDG